MHHEKSYYSSLLTVLTELTGTATPIEGQQWQHELAKLCTHLAPLHIYMVEDNMLWARQ